MSRPGFAFVTSGGRGLRAELETFIGQARLARWAFPRTSSWANFLAPDGSHADRGFAAYFDFGVLVGGLEEAGNRE